MKPPGWLVMDYIGPSASRNAIDYRVTVRKWHPGFWLFLLRMLWRRNA